MNHLAAFIDRWRSSGGPERANEQMFLLELCRVLDVPAPIAKRGTGAEDPYAFDRPVSLRRPDGSISRGRVDLYKQGCFVLEAKHLSGRGGQASSNAMEAAMVQALEYAKNLEPRPPFLIVCDIGRCFDLYACFDGTSRYRPFPNAEGKRLLFEDLARHIPTLRAIWTTPLRLDPVKRAVSVSESAAASLARLAESLRAAGHRPELVSGFLLRCLFTMFAEDVGLLGPRLFTHALETRWIPNPTSFPGEVEALWRAMDVGGRLGLGGELPRFGGGLLEKAGALPLTGEQLRLLFEASRHDWSDVDPAILGTLLGRALDPSRARSAGDGPYPPRAYFERLVRPTVEDVLRAEWDGVRAEVWLLRARGSLDAAGEALRGFQARLAEVRVLDPACEAGGFLCVALDVLRELESEALAELRVLGDSRGPRARVSPAQMLGLDVDPRAKEITEIMLWLAHLGRDHRAQESPGPRSEPVLQRLPGIEHRDALLAWDAKELVRDGKGTPVTRWDGKTTRRSHVSGDLDPDESARLPITQYVNARRAAWPKADFIVGDPPFMGGRAMQVHLGDSYFMALRASFPDLPEGTDYGLYFWDQAARQAREGAARRIGLVTPVGSHRQKLTHLLDDPKRPLRKVFAVEEVAGAALVAMIAVEPGTPGPDIETVVALLANAGIGSAGIQLQGSGFLLPNDAFREAGAAINPATSQPVVRPYVHGRDLMGKPSDARAIDFFGLELEEAARLAPAYLRHLHDLVKPNRESQSRPALRDRWWRFGGDAPLWRSACHGLPRYIATSEIAKHRVFVFVDALVLPDRTLTSLALADAFFLGVLSSRIHLTWALASGGAIADSSRYGKRDCFDPFPFPACTERERRRIRELGEHLDAHRKLQLSAHPGLTMTRIYNVLSRLRSGGRLDETDRVVHEHGLLSVLAQIHDEIDEAVSDTYRFPAGLRNEQIVERLLILNRERAGEERSGLVRWLRPDFQRAVIDRWASPRAAGSTLEDGGEGAEPAGPIPGERLPWPDTTRAQVVAVRDLVVPSKRTWSAAEVAAVFKGAKLRAVAAVLEALSGIGILRPWGPSGEEPRWEATRQRAP